MSAVHTAARLIVSQVKQLERRIRADEQPRFAELHDLFETTKDLERNLDDVGASARVACASRNCPLEGTTEVIAGSGKKYCAFHAEQLRMLLGDQVETQAAS
jgi:hypothetical protein